MKDKFYFKQSDDIRQKALDYITEYFPELMPEIEAYAKLNNAHIGDMAALTISDVILPALEPKMAERFVLSALRFCERLKSLNELLKSK